MRLIDKDVIITEIERRINKEIQSCATDNCFGYSQGCVDSMRNVLSFIDTFEVKEVDLEKELDFVKDAYYYFTSDERSSIKKVAKHFFELGIKAQKGEEV